ncbi:MAG: transcriptional regulator [Candidatus Bipolaricaulota bacterium]|nr:transcriptional regulator [Candidatus Bipolaricaulota bacterium]MCS7275236.1 transcriptional regulator [Candidatus Bipolaricaulota bacterium]MDW8111062.1 transcriptional regulator [Candidatus Bipolaricaulota bacterium]MDW8329567.1 transcriptional regulator [Candidatus Bipolaricaulota bacterium]
MPLQELLCHEEIEPARLHQLIQQAQNNAETIEPILVDQRTKIILDGHHRYHLFKYLGREKIPCCLIDYQADWVEVHSRRPEFTVTKAEVIRRALSGDLYPPKTTKHVVHWPPCLECGITSE